MNRDLAILRMRTACTVLLLTLVAAACGAPAAPAPGTEVTPTPGDGAPRSGGTLRMMGIVDVSQQAGLDPAQARTQSQWVVGDLIFETLVETTPEGDIVPGLAHTWQISDDGLQYTFQLQPGVRFHNGREMTAEDVKYSIERVADPATASPRLNNYSSLASVEAPDDLTVVINLSEPFSPLLATLAHVTAAIIPQEEVAKGNFGDNPVGTGAFKVTEWVRDERWVLDAHDEYWQPGLPYLEQIILTFNGDDSARTAALRSGDVDLLLQVPVQFVDSLQNDPTKLIYGADQMGLSWQHLALNTQRPPFDDVRVRQAIFQAVNRQELATIGKGQYSEARSASFLPSWHWAANNEEIWPQDIDQAQALLQEAGYENGFSMTVYVVSGFDFQTRTAEAIQQQLRPLGIEVSIQIADFGVIANAAGSGDYDGIILVFSPVFDPDDRVQQTFVSGAGLNWPNYSDPRIDELAAQARVAIDMGERGRLYREMQQLIFESGGWVSLYMYNNFDGLQSYVRDYEYFPQFYYRSLRGVWLDQ
jgi:peptide/nickel transport system substrate-binding protein